MLPYDIVLHQLLLLLLHDVVTFDCYTVNCTATHSVRCVALRPTTCVCVSVCVLVRSAANSVRYALTKDCIKL